MYHITEVSNRDLKKGSTVIMVGVWGCRWLSLEKEKFVDYYERSLLPWSLEVPLSLSVLSAPIATQERFLEEERSPTTAPIDPYSGHRAPYGYEQSVPGWCSPPFNIFMGWRDVIYLVICYRYMPLRTGLTSYPCHWPLYSILLVVVVIFVTVLLFRISFSGSVPFP